MKLKKIEISGNKLKYIKKHLTAKQAHNGANLFRRRHIAQSISQPYFTDGK
jgi:hypothetical protein